MPKNHIKPAGHTINSSTNTVAYVAPIPPIEGIKPITLKDIIKRISTAGIFDKDSSYTNKAKLISKSSEEAAGGAGHSISYETSLDGAAKTAEELKAIESIVSPKEKTALSAAERRKEVEYNVHFAQYKEIIFGAAEFLKNDSTYIFTHAEKLAAIILSVEKAERDYNQFLNLSDKPVFPHHYELKKTINYSLTKNYFGAIECIIKEYEFCIDHLDEEYNEKIQRQKSEILTILYDIIEHNTSENNLPDAEECLAFIKAIHPIEFSPKYLKLECNIALKKNDSEAAINGYNEAKEIYFKNRHLYTANDNIEFFKDFIGTAVFIQEPIEDIIALCDEYIVWLSGIKSIDKSFSDPEELNPIFFILLGCLNQNKYDKCFEYLKLFEDSKKHTYINMHIKVAVIKALATIQNESPFGINKYEKEVYKKIFDEILKTISPSHLSVTLQHREDMSVFLYCKAVLAEKTGLPNKEVYELYKQAYEFYERKDEEGGLKVTVNFFKDLQYICALKIFEYDSEELYQASLKGKLSRDQELKKEEILNASKYIYEAKKIVINISSKEFDNKIMLINIKLQKYVQAFEFFKLENINELTLNEKELVAKMLFKTSNASMAINLLDLVDINSLANFSTELLKEYVKHLSSSNSTNYERTSEIFKLIPLRSLTNELKNDYIKILLTTKHFDEAYEVAGSVTNHLSSAIYWYSKCKALASTNKNEAISAAKQMFNCKLKNISLNTQHEMAKFHIEALYEKGQYDEVLEEAANYLRKAIKLSDLNHIYAECYIKGSHKKGARELLEKLESWEENSEESYKKLAVILLENEEYALANEYFDRFYYRTKDLIPVEISLEFLANACIKAENIKCLKALDIYAQGDILSALLVLEELYEAGFNINFVKKTLIKYAIEGEYFLTALKYLEQEDEPVKFANELEINIKDIYLQAIKAYIEPGHHNLAEAVIYFNLVKDGFNNKDLATIWGADKEEYSNPKAEMQTYLAFICFEEYRLSGRDDKALTELASSLLNEVNIAGYKHYRAEAFKGLLTCNNGLKSEDGHIVLAVLEKSISSLGESNLAPESE